MKLYLVKSDLVKCRYFFQSEVLATKLFEELRSSNEDVVLKYLATSDEWTIEQLTQHFEQLKESL